MSLFSAILYDENYFSKFFASLQEQGFFSGDKDYDYW